MTGPSSIAQAPHRGTRTEAAWNLKAASGSSVISRSVHASMVFHQTKAATASPVASTTDSVSGLPFY